MPSDCSNLKEVDPELRNEIEVVYEEINEQIAYFRDIVMKKHPDTPDGQKLREEFEVKMKELNARVNALYERANEKRLKKMAGMNNEGNENE
jgi:hypothetical protein